MEVDSHRRVAVPSLMSASGVLLLCRSSHFLTLSYIRGLPIVRRLSYSVNRAIQLLTNRGPEVKTRTRALLPNHLCFLVVSGCMNTRRTSSTMARTYHSFIRSGVSILSDHSLNKAASGTCLGHHFYVSSQTLKTLISIAPFKEGDRNTVTESKTRGKSMKGHIFKLRGGEYLLFELWWCRGLFRFICSVSVQFVCDFVSGLRIDIIHITVHTYFDHSQLSQC